MDLIRELLEVSEYRPSSGHLSDMLRLIETGFSRSEALHQWTTKGRSQASFYKIYKALKDDLVRLAFLEGKNFPEVESHRLEVWEKYKVFSQLIVTQRKYAAVTLGIEIVRMAIKTGFTEIVVNVASVLEIYFGSTEIDTRRYLRYRKLRKNYFRMLEDELDVKALLARLVFYINKKKDLSELEEEMIELASQTTGSFTFMRIRYSALSVWYDHKGDFKQMRKLFEETLNFYEHCEVELPATTLITPYFRLIPALVAQKMYAEAEKHLSKALHLAKEGTQNWHLFMLQKACLGLVSGKKGIAKACRKKASLAPREHNNPEIDERWEVVKRLTAEEESDFEKIWKVIF